MTDVDPVFTPNGALWLSAEHWLENWEAAYTPTEALWLSAEHWLENWESARRGDLKSIDGSEDSCTCCNQYRTLSGCFHCPIAQHTGQNYCRGTPYSQVVNSRLDYLLRGGKETLPHIQESLERACEEEYRFLVTLALGEKK